jgi:hypothetical protein
MDLPVLVFILVLGYSPRVICQRSFYSLSDPRQAHLSLQGDPRRSMSEAYRQFLQHPVLVPHRLCLTGSRSRTEVETERKRRHISTSHLAKAAMLDRSLRSAEVRVSRVPASWLENSRGRTTAFYNPSQRYDGPAGLEIINILAEKLCAHHATHNCDRKAEPSESLCAECKKGHCDAV